VDLFASFDPKQLYSTPGIRTDLFEGDDAETGTGAGAGRRLEDVKLTDFFGGRRRGVRVLPPRGWQASGGRVS
jgi:glycosylphosphatidylinositol transamidase (GPIT) subunit GPI8